MTNRNVIEIIDRLMDPNVEKVAYNANEVFVAIVHGYYYIKPGYNTIRFIKKINKILNKGWKDKSKECNETKNGVSYEVWLWGKMAADALGVARSMFDKEYYASQISKMVMHEKYDDTLLERYMYWLNEEELHSVFEGILTFKSNLDVFISDVNFDSMMEELKDCSINVIRNDPLYMKDYDKHIAYIDNHWDFSFEYLCRETIIDTICRYVDEYPVILAWMIKTFKYAGVHAATEYTGLVICLIYGFALDIINPKITDVSKIRLEDYDYRHSQVIHSNNAGKFMIVAKSE